MPSTTPPPGPAVPLLNAEPANTSDLDRAESELGALLQQARQTQATLQQLQAQELQDASTPWWPDMPAVTAASGVAWAAGSALLLASAALWWRAGRGPGTRPHQESGARTPGNPPESSFAPVAPAPQTQTAGPVGFDSQAAAHEVMRVRKSLASKRQARALLRQREDSARSGSASTLSGLFVDDMLQHPDIDLGLLEPSALPVNDAVHAVLPLAASAVVQAPLFAPPPQAGIDSHYELPMDIAVGPEDDEPAEPDSAVKLELAEQALALNLLPQARDLAIEVLDGHDTPPKEQAQAHVILQQIDQIEHDTAQALLPWSDDL